VCDYLALSYLKLVKHPKIRKPQNSIKASMKITRGLKIRTSTRVATKNVSKVINLYLYVRASTVLMQIANANEITIIIVTTFDIADFLES
jgi:hypothetical protein